VLARCQTVPWEEAVTSKLKGLALLAVVGAGALLPLYGDPRTTGVSHAEWARMILRSLDLIDSGILTDQASQVFATLSWKNSLSYRADRYAKAAGVEVDSGAGAPWVRATAGVGTLAYPVAVTRGGDYRLRLRLAGESTAPAEADIAPAGQDKPLKAFAVAPSAGPAWVDAGQLHLDPGAYTASVLLPPGTALEYVELAPPCLNPIEPFSGWQARAITTSEDLAVTTVKALDLEHELPPSEPKIEVTGAQMVPERALPIPATAGTGPEGQWLKAGPEGVRAVVLVNLPQPGLYTLSVFGRSGNGQSWVADACRKAVLCPEPEAAGAARWRPVMTGRFTSGPHAFGVSLASGAVIERVRVERRKETAEDYVATLRRLGLDPGPEGPVSRDVAVDAMNLIQGRRRLSLESGPFCGDIEVPGVVVAGAGTPGSGTGPGSGAGGPGGPGVKPSGPGNPGTPQPPIAPPVVPPQQVASPDQP
jgi:hypothetical protein